MVSVVQRLALVVQESSIPIPDDLKAPLATVIAPVTPVPSVQVPVAVAPAPILEASPSFGAAQETLAPRPAPYTEGRPSDLSIFGYSEGEEHSVAFGSPEDFARSHDQIIPTDAALAAALQAASHVQSQSSPLGDMAVEAPSS